MQTVTVNASKQYDVLIGSGVRALLPEKISSLFGSVRVCLVSDDNVARLHLDEAETLLQNAGFNCSRFVFPHGEASKNPTVLFELLEHLADERFSRKDVLVALGGGVTGDLGGLAAALYMRGMHLVQIPTSLLAMVDSSVGGKTAVDLKAGKNLAGVFNQPDLVLCDPDYLSTLPPEDFSDGMAEVVKYGVIADEALFDTVKDGCIKDRLTQIITRCVTIKRDVVDEDEFDTGRRALLNFGHTLAHAIEAKSNFTVSHGKAVAIGMCRIAALAEQHGLCDAPCLKQIQNALTNNDLPTDTAFLNAELFDEVTKDKKCTGGSITLILPRRIGDCYARATPIDECKRMLS
ncbi:MAG: 3-dehydroquinate synthase [Clostridia bacterium]|nr:3-dehydroquinate synthase [Clostridia bacterium]